MLLENSAGDSPGEATDNWRNQSVPSADPSAIRRSVNASIRRSLNSFIDPRRAGPERRDEMNGRSSIEESAMTATRQSLLIRACDGDETSWQDLVALYRPFIVAWLRRGKTPPADIDDLTQEILVSVVQYLPGFRHSGQPGSFRSWLRSIVRNRSRDYWRSRDTLPAAQRDDALEAVGQLEDPDSEPSRVWDHEHDRHVLRSLLQSVEPEFEPSTFQAFRLVAIDGASGAEAARKLGLSISAIYTAKSRVLRRIRQQAAGLID